MLPESHTENFTQRVADRLVQLPMPRSLRIPPLRKLLVRVARNASPQQRGAALGSLALLLLLVIWSSAPLPEPVPLVTAAAAAAEPPPPSAEPPKPTAAAAAARANHEEEDVCGPRPAAYERSPCGFVTDTGICVTHAAEGSPRFMAQPVITHREQPVQVVEPHPSGDGCAPATHTRYNKITLLYRDIHDHPARIQLAHAYCVQYLVHMFERGVPECLLSSA